MVDVRNDYEKFRQAEAEVAVATMAAPRKVARFRESKRLPFVCLSDPDKELYRAYHLPRGGLVQMTSPRVILAGPKALFRGGLGIPRGDLRQMPGTFIIDRGGILRFVHYAANIADNPPNADLIALLESLSPDG